MEFIKRHIQHSLVSFLNVSNTSFLEVFNNIQHEEKTTFELLLRYLDSLLIEFNKGINEEIQAIHFHFEEDLEAKALISEFLLVKNYLANLNIDIFSQSEPNQLLLGTINRLTNNVSRDLYFPEGLKRKQENQIRYERILQKSLLKFYESLNKKATLKFKSLFNLQINTNKLIIPLFVSRPYAIQLGQTGKSYNLLNTSKTLNEIDEFDNEIIDNIETIILFDCERKKIMANFSFEEINKWNSEYGTNCKQYLIFTFGKEIQSFNNIRNKIDTIRERFKIPMETTYTILSSEIDFLLKRTKNSSILSEFIGFETSSFWDSFLLETSIRELYELRSIKLMNIYSLCLTQEIKNYILDELFSNSESSELVSSNTKLALLELRDDDISVIKESLSNTLDLIINSDIKSKITGQFNDISTIILDEAIIKNSKLISQFSKAFHLIKSIKLKSWSELSSVTTTNFLILSYRDQGNYPNYYCPNLLEYEFNNKIKVTAILPNFLFGNHYKWSKYYLLKDYYKYLNHPIRQNHFEWNKLKSTIQSLRPDSKLKIDWNLEYEFSNSEHRESYRVKVKNQRIKTFNSSVYLIFSEKSAKKPRIERVKWLYETLDLNECDYEIQNLDDLLDEFNPAEKLIDTTQQEKELEIIRKQLGLENETAGRIWKVLLKRKSDTIGVGKFYEELKRILETNNVPIVSISHFQNCWINLESDTLMPRGNKVFKILCDYLGLKNNYRLILYSLKNASNSGKIEATKQYSRLLKDLFSDCCFDENVSARTILQSKIEHYKANHNLEGLGIDSENPLRGLVTLIELIQPEIKVLELESIEKIEQ